MPKECKVTLAEHEITEFTQQDFIKKGDMIEEETPKSSIGRFRQQLSDTLHHHYFQIIICVLVLLDTAVVVTEIMVDSSRSHSKSEHLETAEFALHYVSLTILSIFMFEITLKIFAMGLKFLKHKFEIFDAIIVSVSFFLDVFLSSGGLKDGVEFLVLLRLWRITRIINGIVVSIKARSEEKVEKAKEQVAELHEKVEEQQKTIDNLRKAIYQLGYDPNLLA
ncbi:voltage-gated hydrogen channel 1-like isoform X2 [Clytia hemisphaerica]|uniref:Voltage-gated hydrogen channel 1 n=1 Tax=Clytia hemisphaerica TaxID=252671 RepID=A0A7M5XGJ5_9CNID